MGTAGRRPTTDDYRLADALLGPLRAAEGVDFLAPWTEETSAA